MNRDDLQERFVVRQSTQRLGDVSDPVLAWVNNLSEATAIAMTQNRDVPLEIWDKRDKHTSVLRWMVWHGVVYEKSVLSTLLFTPKAGEQ